MSSHFPSVYRFAPSPTGNLHVGGARTAIFNWLLARKTGGRFLVRVEDTDKKRSSEAYTQQILESMTWLGIDWDEGIWYQSRRMERYREVADRLLASGGSYHCYCSREEIAARRGQSDTYLYDGHCRDLSTRQVDRFKAQDRRPVIRIRNSGDAVVYEDLIHGEIRVAGKELDDFVILRSDGSPVYQLAVVTDDHDMEVTTVIRGDDHISNTPKQILLYLALDWQVPHFGHIPLILGPDKRPLSKRHGASSVMEFRDQGIVPEALFNYLCLLGWAPGDDRELFSREELIDTFSLERINAANAVFDYQKLLWMNGKYISRMSPETLYEYLIARDPSLEKKIAPGEIPRFFQLLTLLRERGKTLEEIEHGFTYFFEAPQEYDEKGMKKYFMSGGGVEVIRDIRDRLGEVSDFSADMIESRIREYAEDREIGAGKVIHPIRLAVTGRTFSPGIFELLEILGRERVIDRLDRSLEFIDKRSSMS